jgi:hypothetical protein
MASTILSNLLMLASPLIKKVIRQDVSLLQIQNCISIYSKISRALSTTVLCTNFIHAMLIVAFMNKNTFDRSQIRLAKYKYLPVDDNKPIKLSYFAIIYLSCIKLVCVDTFWPYLLINFLFGVYHVPLVLMTLEIT